MDELNKIFKNMKTMPYLFVGSGISKRYLNLPSWEELLKYINSLLPGDKDIRFSTYVRRSKKEDGTIDYAAIASELSKDFDNYWSKSPAIYSLPVEYINFVIKKYVSPFKVVIAHYINEFSEVKEEYNEEINKLKNLKTNNIAGIVTTNYDCFLEKKIFDSGYSVYKSQKDLILNSNLNVGEIYKIHGCVTDPETIVITKKDYEKFEEYSQYLVSKLLSIFVENPIIFLGYSISDENIKTLLNSILKIVPNNKITELKEKFILVRRSNTSEIKVIDTHINLEDKIFPIKVIEIKDFGILYDKMKMVQNKIPVKILRQLKDMLHNLVLDNGKTDNIFVQNIHQSKDNELAISIGNVDEIRKISQKGVVGITSEEWIKNYLFNSLGVIDNKVLIEGLNNLNKMNSYCLPFFKYIQTEEDYETLSLENKKIYDNLSYDFMEENQSCLIPKTLLIKRERLENNPFLDLEKEYNERCLKDFLETVSLFEENNINPTKLEDILKKIMTDNPNLLKCEESMVRTNFRRAVRILDYIKHKKRED